MPSPPGRKHRVWVVDDDAEIRSMLATYLGQQGYDVRTLADGAQLMARLQSQRPDVLVLDLMLPGDDGLTLLRRLRDADDDLPVLMLTARADAVDRIIGLEQGADDYLPSRSCRGSSPPASRRCCAAAVASAPGRRCRRGSASASAMPRWIWPPAPWSAPASPWRSPAANSPCWRPLCSIPSGPSRVSA
jgi:CheY-like chemotaxis protein